jgi:hypothetical protein
MQCLPQTMFLVVRADGKYWDGLAWAEQGREFLSVGHATRSLYEEGEGLENAQILSTEPASQ